MAEVEKYVFDYKEIVTQLIKSEDIHEGIWSLYVEFGMQAANVQMLAVEEGAPPPIPTNPPTNLAPTVVIPVQKIGIVKTGVLTNLAVDAAEVNPKSISARKTPEKK